MPLTVSGLYCYPLKSARGIALQSAEVEARGLRDDRRWMVVNQRGEFLSQRDLPRMACIEVALTRDGLSLRVAAGAEVPVPRGGGAPLEVIVWGDRVQAECCSAVADAWLSALLGEPCRVVYMPDHVLRAVDRHYAGADDVVGFADGFPLLLIGQGSLDELNQRLDAGVPMDRFRPNVVVAGAAPHAEDGWAHICAGDIEMLLVKPCSRCPMPGIDQLSGERSREPLPALSRYRRQDGEIWFGQNVIARSLGRLQVGDPVRVVDRLATPRPNLPL